MTWPKARVVATTHAEFLHESPSASELLRSDTGLFFSNNIRSRAPLRGRHAKESNCASNLGICLRTQRGRRSRPRPSVAPSRTCVFTHKENSCNNEQLFPAQISNIARWRSYRLSYCVERYICSVCAVSATTIEICDRNTDKAKLRRCPMCKYITVISRRCAVSAVPICRFSARVATIWEYI